MILIDNLKFLYMISLEAKRVCSEIEDGLSMNSCAKKLSFYMGIDFMLVRASLESETEKYLNNI